MASIYQSVTDPWPSDQKSVTLVQLHRAFRKVFCSVKSEHHKLQCLIYHIYLDRGLLIRPQFTFGLT